MKQKEKVNFLSEGLGNPKRKLTHDEQLALYANAKQRQQRVAHWMLQNAPDLVKQQESLSVCASLLIFHHYYRLHRHLLRGGITCKQHLLCAPCSLRRSASYAKAYYRAIQHLLKEHADWAPVLITKTIRNSSNLGTLYQEFIKAHAKLILRRRHALQAKKIRLKTPTIYSAFLGGVGSYEYKRGAFSKLWHPHSHELAFIRFVDWKITPVREFRWRKVDGKRVQIEETVYKPLEIESRLREEWKQLTGGSWVCDVRMVAWSDQGLTQNDEELFGAVAEVMGYCLKMQEISPDDQVEAYRILRRRRLTYTYGALRNVELPDEAMDDDDTIPEDEPWVELIYRWWADRKEYSLAEAPRQPADALISPHQSLPKKSSRGKRKKVQEETASGDILDIINDWIAQQEV